MAASGRRLYHTALSLLLVTGGSERREAGREDGTDSDMFEVKTARLPVRGEILLTRTRSHNGDAQPARAGNKSVSAATRR